MRFKEKHLKSNKDFSLKIKIINMYHKEDVLISIVHLCKNLKSDQNMKTCTPARIIYIASYYSRDI